MTSSSRGSRLGFRATFAATTLSCCLALAAGAAAASAPVSIRVPADLSPAANVTISFRPKQPLPRGGYYYAVVVLTNYAGYSLTAPPPCAISSDMEKTAYGYPRRGRRVTLALRQATSHDAQWCAGATYTGAVYAVPHKPPCTVSYPCVGTSAEYGGDCWEVDGRPVCGVVAKPEPPITEPTPQQPESSPKQPQSPGSPSPPQPASSYSYPGGLPKPIDRSSRIVARFVLRFATASSSS